MPDEFVNFLDTRRIGRRDDQTDITLRSHALATLFSGEADCLNTTSVGNFKGLEDVGRSPARADGSQDIAGSGQGFHLA